MQARPLIDEIFKFIAGISILLLFTIPFFTLLLTQYESDQWLVYLFSVALGIGFLFGVFDCAYFSEEKYPLWLRGSIVFIFGVVILPNGTFLYLIIIYAAGVCVGFLFAWAIGLRRFTEELLLFEKYSK